jgi:hypothetical protein
MMLKKPAFWRVRGVQQNMNHIRKSFGGDISSCGEGERGREREREKQNIQV